MQFTVIAQWFAREWARSGWTWLVALALASLLPLCLLGSPTGIVSTSISSGLYLESIWFLSTYCGALVGLALLARAGSLLDELGGGRRQAVVIGLIFCVVLLHGAAGTLPLRAWSAPGEASWKSELLCAGHWALIAAFVQRTPLTLVGQCLMLTCLGWWLPALLEGAPSANRLSWILDPKRHLLPPTATIETSWGVLVDTIPFVAWWVATALLPTRSAFQR